MKYFKIFFILFIATALGALAYGASIQYYTAQTLYDRTLVFEGIQSHVLKTLFVYGTVQSVDTERNAITMALPSTAPTQAHTITMNVTKNTEIFHQELQSDQNGTYVGISEPTRGTFEQLTPDTRIAVTFRKSDDGFEATLILFGNPL